MSFHSDHAGQLDQRDRNYLTAIGDMVSIAKSCLDEMNYLRSSMKSIKDKAGVYKRVPSADRASGVLKEIYDIAKAHQTRPALFAPDQPGLLLLESMEHLKRVLDAAFVLIPDYVKTRDAGKCSECNGYTSSGMNRYCTSCAREIIASARSFLDKIDAWRKGNGNRGAGPFGE